METLKKYIIILFIPFLLFLNSCSSVDGTGEYKKETRKVEGFSSLRVDVPADVLITYGDTPSVIMEAQENILAVVYSRVHGDRLNIDSDKRLGNHLPIKVYLTMNKLSEIKLNGSGSIKTTGSFRSEKLELGMSGSGELFIQSDCEKISADLYGSGVINLAGKAQKGELNLSGSGKFDAVRMMIDDCEIDINGSGDATLNVGSSLDATINGSGNIVYNGNAPKVKTSINGSGKIVKM